MRLNNMYEFKCDNKYNKKLHIPDFSSRYYNIFNSTKKNIIIIKDEFDQSTFRYRGYNVIQSMKDNKKYNLDCFLYKELFTLYDILDKIDLVILQRTFWSFELETFINVLKINNIKIIFDIDDLIYNPKYVPEYLNSIADYSKNRSNYYFSYSIKLYLIAKMCDGFIVTTKNLQDKIKKNFNKPVWIFHNYLNIEQEKISKEIINLKKKSFSSKKFIIGYFSGSRSHKRDFEIVESALIKLMNKYDDIYIKIVGYMDLHSNFNIFKDKGRIIFSKYVPFEELQYEIGQVDLNIIPLQKHDFNDCKSELKYFEASIVNTLTCATDNDVFKNVINDGVDGFLSDEMSWFEKIEYIYLNYNNLDKVVETARIKCLNEYGNKNQEKNLEKMYDEIFQNLNI